MTGLPYSSSGWRVSNSVYATAFLTKERRLSAAAGAAIADAKAAAAAAGAAIAEARATAAAAGSKALLGR